MTAPDAEWDFVPGVGFINKGSGEAVPLARAVPIAEAVRRGIKTGDVVELPVVDEAAVARSFDECYRGDLKTPAFDGELKPPGHSDWQPIKAPDGAAGDTGAVAAPAPPARDAIEEKKAELRELDQRARAVPGFRAASSTPCLTCAKKHAGRCVPRAEILFMETCRQDLTEEEEDDQRTRCFAGFVAEASAVCLVCGRQHVKRCTPGVDPRGYPEPIGPKPSGRVFEGKGGESYPPVMPSVVEKFLAETSEGRDAAAVMKEIAAPALAGENGIPDLQNTAMFWRRMFLALIEEAFKGKPAWIHSWKMWFDDAVWDLQHDRPRIDAERDAFNEGIGVVVWESNLSVRPADVHARRFEIFHYTYPGGQKPKCPPPLFQPRPRPAAASYPRPFPDVPAPRPLKPAVAPPPTPGPEARGDLFGGTSNPPAEQRRRY